MGYRLVTSLKVPQLINKTYAVGKLSILMYHAVIEDPLYIHDWCFLDSDTFRTQLRYLKTHFNVIRLSEGIEEIKKYNKKRPLAAVTFDDGFQNNYDIAFPILREENIPATIFLTTNLIDTDDILWFCKLNQVLAKTQKLRFNWNGKVLNLKSPINKAKASSFIQAKLKETPHPRLLNEIRKIIVQLNDNPDYQINLKSPYRMLSSAAILKMAKSNLIDFGAHTHNHAILRYISSKDKKKEIEKSLDLIEQLTGNHCKFFSYPNGRKQDYDDECIKILKSNRVKAAFTTIPGPNNSATSSMNMRRYGIAGNIDKFRFQMLVNHFFWLIKRTKKRIPK